VLLGGLPWAHSVFGQSASYCPLTGTTGTGAALEIFYAAAPSLPPPPRPAIWRQVAEQFRSIYDRVLAN
jgi:hypothetical protein